MSLLTAAERLAATDRSEVVFNADRCLYTKSKFSECTACYQICPVSAINAGKPPVFNAEQCETCLACIPVCPTGSFTADDEVTSLLKAASHWETGTLELICGHNTQPGVGTTPASIGLRVHKCLAGLGTGTYAELAALGFERIQLRCETCQACPWASLRVEIGEQAARANEFLKGWGKDKFVEVVDKIAEPAERPFWNTDSPHISRRELFRLIANRGQTLMARAWEDVSTSSERRPGRDRMRLIAAVEHLPAWEQTASSRLDGFGSASVNVAETCFACAACAKACPTGALTFNKEVNQKHFSIEFSASKCIACGICAHVCVTSALALRPVSTLTGFFGSPKATLIEGNLVKCERCGAEIPERDGANLCPVCAVRIKNLFGSDAVKRVPG